MVHQRAPDAGDAGIVARLSGLVQACPELQQASRIVVAFSGGVDSTALLHLLHEACTGGALRAPLHVLHVNHKMQLAADQWEAHCGRICAALGLEFECARVPVAAVAGQSLEETARNARHAVFASALRKGDVLALAQHQDDQVETVLFRLLRGSGAAGLGGMPHSRACGDGLLARPLLEASRGELVRFAEARRLAWIEDPSNTDQRFDRNFLRSSVLPALYERWPGLAGAVQRSARLSDEAAFLLDELARHDAAVAAGPSPAQLCIAPLLALAGSRQRNVIRYWLQAWSAQHARAAPTHQVLMRIVTEVIPAGPDAEPLLTWGEGAGAVELRRHRGLLHVMAPLPAVPGVMAWRTTDPLMLPGPLGVLELCSASGKALARERLRDLRVCFRGGGEMVKAAGRPTRPLKKILQEAGVPPWLRERIPLLYAGDEMVAVADLLVCDGWLAEAPENGCRVVWRHPDLDCGYPPHLLI